MPLLVTDVCIEVLANQRLQWLKRLNTKWFISLFDGFTMWDDISGDGITEEEALIDPTVRTFA